LSKAAKILKSSPEELKQLLDLYKQRSTSRLQDTPFEKTILSRLLGGSTQLDFNVEGDVITITESQLNTNYVGQFEKMNRRMEDIARELESL